MYIVQWKQKDENSYLTTTILFSGPAFCHFAYLTDLGSNAVISEYSFKCSSSSGV